MTINSTYAAQNFVPNGPQEYAFTFQHIGAETIAVYEINAAGETSIIPATDYTVTVGASAGSVYLFSGGQVDFLVPHLADTVTVQIARVTQALQLVDFFPYTTFPAEASEFAHDRSILILQELKADGIAIAGGELPPSSSLPPVTRLFSTLAGAFPGWYENVWTVNGTADFLNGFVGPTDGLGNGFVMLGNGFGGGIYQYEGDAPDTNSPVIAWLKDGAVVLNYDSVGRIQTSETGVDINGRVSGMSDGVDPNDAVTKQQLDAAAGGLTPGTVDKALLSWDNTGGAWGEETLTLAFDGGGFGVLAAVDAAQNGVGFLGNAAGGQITEVIGGDTAGGQTYFSWLAGGAVTMNYGGVAHVTTTPDGFDVGGSGIIGGVTDTPTLDDHAASKAYVDAVAGGGGLVPGTITYAGLHWDGANWVQADDGRIIISGGITYMAGMASGNGIAMGANATAGGIYAATGATIGTQLIGVTVGTGAVNLNYGGSVKLVTTNNGVTVTGRVSGLTDPSSNQDAATKAYVDSQIGSVPSLPGGTTTNASIRWSGSAWVEETSFQITSSGQIRTTNGSAGTPSHSFTGDSDTGMYRSATNELSFTCGGTRRARITSSGVLWSYGSIYSADLSSGGNVESFGGTLIISPSDARYKKEIHELEYGLNELEVLPTVRYKWDDKLLETEGEIPDKERIGFLAQDVEMLMPDLITEVDQMGVKGMKTIDKTDLIPVLVNAVKELSARVKELEANQ